MFTQPREPERFILAATLVVCATVGFMAETAAATAAAPAASSMPRPAASAAAGGPARSVPATWQVDAAQSSIRFTATQAGANFEGRFKQFNAAISFDPANLGASRARVEIPVMSVDTQSSDRDTALKSKDWFDPARWPKAVFETSRISTSGSSFIADGRLTMRDRTRPVRLTFSVRRAANGVRTLTGQAKLSRLAFGLGQGEFQSTEWVADAVTVNVTIVAR